MSENPLSPPGDAQILRKFRAHFGLPADGSPLQLLKGVATAFARLPYENLTKIIKEADIGNPERARRGPSEVIGGHIDLGAGGTCFSLTAALLYLVRSLGWKAEPILADRRYGQNTHCALIVWIGGLPHLLDPGFLIVDPLPIVVNSRQEIKTDFNRIILSPEGGGVDRFSLFTVQKNATKYRLTFRTQPADPGEFLRAWEESFRWDMMRYPLLTRVSGDRHLYLRGTRFQISSADSVERREIAMSELIPRIAADFRIHPSVVARAVSILKEKGETYGKTAAR